MIGLPDALTNEDSFGVQTDRGIRTANARLAIGRYEEPIFQRARLPMRPITMKRRSITVALLATVLVAANATSAAQGSHH
jgi:hypothetical protein